MWRYLNYLLYPFSLLYGLVLWLRNRLYDRGVLTAVQFDLPVIAVGNLSVGGTGKTPHVEYLIRLLKEAYTVATLSRGYNRRTKGYLLAKADSTAADIGDEPMQFHHKYPGVTVCVGEERMLAVPQLLGDRPEIQVILLDDAFQHRSIKPGLNIMVTDYSRLFTRDHVVPFGRLREGRKGYHRANCIIVSKCPPDLSEQQRQVIIKEIDPLPHQRVFFTTLQYGQPYGLITEETPPPASTILVACGIARPEPLVQHLLHQYANVHLLSFPDHYYYTQKDLDKIKAELDHLDGDRKFIFTTEKDAVRLHLLQERITAMQLPIAVVPVEVRFLFDEADSFNSYIFDYVAEATLAAQYE